MQWVKRQINVYTKVFNIVLSSYNILISYLSLTKTVVSRSKVKILTFNVVGVKLE